MEIVKVLGIDPSLRNTGLAIVSFNTDYLTDSPEAFKVEHCQTLVNPQKYTGKDAILNMLDMLQTESLKKCYRDVDTVLVEAPAIMYNMEWAQGTISSIAHISGGAIALFGIDKCHLFRPNEWNRTRKKDKTHFATKTFLGDPDDWHFEKRVKSEKHMEHILDAASMSLWWIKSNYVEET